MSSLKQSPLVYSILETFTSAELRNFSCLDLDRGASARITAGAGSTLADIEGTETDQCNHPTFFQRCFYSSNRCIQRTTRSSFGQISRFGDLINQFRFIHV